MASDVAMEHTLSKFGDKDIDGWCFSDHIYVFDNKMRRRRMRLLITEKGLYLFGGKRKKWRLKRRYLTSNLIQVTITSKNYTLTLFSFSSGYDLLIDSYRRLDIILYIAQRAKRSGFKLFKLLYLNSFKLRKRDREEIEINYKKNFKSQLPILQETFRNTRRSGYLKMKKKRFIGSKYQEYFFLMSNIGIIYFKSYGVSILLTLFRLGGAPAFCRS